MNFFSLVQALLKISIRTRIRWISSPPPLHPSVEERHLAVPMPLQLALEALIFRPFPGEKTSSCQVRANFVAGVVDVLLSATSCQGDAGKTPGKRPLEINNSGGDNSRGAKRIKTNGGFHQDAASATVQGQKRCLPLLDEQGTHILTGPSQVSRRLRRGRTEVSPSCSQNPILLTAPSTGRY